NDLRWLIGRPGIFHEALQPVTQVICISHLTAVASYTHAVLKSGSNQILPALEELPHAFRSLLHLPQLTWTPQSPSEPFYSPLDCPKLSSGCTTVMLRVSPSADFTRFGPMDLERVATSDAPSLAGCGRLRSCSLYAPEASGGINTDRNFRRPRSRSFYTLESSNSSDASRSGAERQGFFQMDTGNRHAKPGPRRSTATKHKHLKKDHAGSRASPKSVPMLTISEPDSWEISSSSGMKYGQYVDWEKIDPEAAIRYQNIISSDHAKLKEMGRSGFWTMPHTLRAKAYHHIIHRIERRGSVVDTDTYRDLSGQLFEEHGTSTHPFPKFMEDGEIPRYCLNKAGLNSVKKILLCISQNLPEVTFCPILPALVSLLLHYCEDEAQCFHSICSLVSFTDPQKRYIDQTFITTHASCMTFGDLANKYCRGIRKLIASSHQSLFEFYSDWIMWIFADLPFSYAIRVLDVYLIEGYKVLYRVALALLSLYKVSVSSRVAHVDDFRQDMKRFVENVSRHSSVEALLQRAFSIQLPTRKELNFLYNANKQALIQRGIQNQRTTTEQWAGSHGQHPVGIVPWAASCGQHPVGRVLWVASCGQHSVGDVLWAGSRGQGPVGSVLWTASCGRCPVGRVLQASSCGQRPVDSILWEVSCGQCPEGRVLQAASCGQHSVGGVLWAGSYRSVELGGFCSSVVSETEMRVVWAWIPERFALFSPVRLFSTADHGRSLTSFYSRVEGHEPTVLLLKTVDEEVCGAFLSSDWTLRNRDGRRRQFFGTEECFVFTLRPGMERYQRTVLHISGMMGMSGSTSPAGTSQDPKYLSVPFGPAEPPQPKARFMAGDDELLFIGGDGGQAICLLADLSSGQSERCDTFESPVLCRGRFRIQTMEVWGIQHTLTLPHTQSNTPSQSQPLA
ncbi:hypothetical protein NFI96_030621, partial [Prochilodus magdalenae]